MKSDLAAIDEVPGVHRIENFSKEEMIGLSMEMTHAVYPHDQIYGQFCAVQDHIRCPAETAFDYLADVYSLGEWTYSLRDIAPTSEDGLVVATDRIGGATKIYARVVANRQAMTVDYHCAWDQGERLWMIYLMRIVPAELVFDKPGCVVLWTNCRHPFYDRNPFPEKAPAGREVWVGDMWPFFFAGHKIELDNLKFILEHRHAQGWPTPSGGFR